MTRAKILSYGALLAVAVVGSFGVSWADRIVQQAILIMWKEPWMQEFAETQIAELKIRHLADVPEGGFPRRIELAAIELDQAIAWSD